MRAGIWDIHTVMRTEVNTTILRELIDSNGETYGEIEIDVVASYYGGCPQREPSYNCGGTPEEHPEVEIVSAFHKKDEIALSLAEISEIEEKILNDPPCDDQGYED